MNEKVFTSSYGLRLLRTVSGQRDNIFHQTKKIDVSALKEFNPDLLCFKTSIILGAGRLVIVKVPIFITM